MSAERAIQEVIEQLVEAWNRRDWPAFSSLFTEDADYVTSAGNRLAGRGRILQDLGSRLETSPASGEISLVAESVRILRPDVAVILCRWQMVDSENRRAGLLTMVVQSAADEWRIQALHNTDSDLPA